MYSATQLSKMFKTTRATIYSKFKHTDIQKFVVDTKQGKKLLPEGLNQFQLLMSESKVYKESEHKAIQPVQLDTSFKNNYINSLRDQIEHLKQENEILRDDKNKQIEDLREDKEKLLNQLEKQIELAKNSQLLLLEGKKEKKRSWLSNLFKSE